MKIGVAFWLLLLVVVFLTVKHYLLSKIWIPTSTPDDNQDECRAGGSQLKKAEHSQSGTVRVIRLTDDGEFANRCELTDVLYEIRNPKKSELLVWYIHGWKHNAAESDCDLLEFRSLIEDLNEQQRQLGEDGLHVVGVYIGWDGAVGPPFLQDMTFWRRKRAADRISQSAVLVKIFSSTRYAREQAGEKVTSRDLTVMIGHSFGARILYTATSHVLLDEVQRQHPGYKKRSYGLIEGPANLILLLNPAFEASMFTAMHGIRRPDSNWWEGVDPRQQPLLLAIATENDWATRYAFPLGQWLDFARRDRQLQTLGNYQNYVTHTLETVSSTDRAATNGSFWFDGFEAAGLRLQLKEGSRHAGNPFIVARTTPRIIDGHNGIWGKDLREWIVLFLGKVQDQRHVSSKAGRQHQ